MDELGVELAATLRRAESFPVQAVGDLRRRVSLVAQRRDPLHELVEVAELLVGLDRPDDLMLAGETAMPMDL